MLWLGAYRSTCFATSGSTESWVGRWFQIFLSLLSSLFFPEIAHGLSANFSLLVAGLALGWICGIYEWKGSLRRWISWGWQGAANIRSTLPATRELDRVI